MVQKRSQLEQDDPRAHVPDMAGGASWRPSPRPRLRRSTSPRGKETRGLAAKRAQQVSLAMPCLGLDCAAVQPRAIRVQRGTRVSTVTQRKARGVALEGVHG